MELANRQTNRNRRVECDVCGKPMRSDHLKRHKQTHKDLLALPDNEIKKELVRPYVKAAYTKLTLCASSNKRNEGICHVSSSQCEKTTNLLSVEIFFVKPICIK